MRLDVPGLWPDEEGLINEKTGFGLTPFFGNRHIIGKPELILRIASAPFTVF